MTIKFFCTRWGTAHLSWDQFLTQVKNAGYDGVETDLPFDPVEKKEILDLIKSYELELIAQHWQTSVADFEVHFSSFEKHLENLVDAQPLLVNTHTGRDFFPFDQNRKLIERALQIEEESGIPIAHETHRGRFSFAAHITKQFLEQLPNLQLNLDISHWCCVSESFLEEQTAAVDLAISRTRHIHARVGNTQSPQISEPRAPENEAALNQHLEWWDAVVESAKKRGLPSLSITPEFGPAPYLLTFPYTQLPIVDQWEMNVFMMDLLKQRYAEFVGLSIGKP